MNGVGDDDSMDDVGGFDAVEDSAQGGTGSSSGGGVGDSVGEGSGYGDTYGIVEDIALADVMANIDPMGYQPNLMDVYNNPKSPAFESHIDPNYEFQNILKTPFGPVFYSTITDKGEANIAEQDAF